VTKPHEETWSAHKDCVVMTNGWRTIFVSHEDMGPEPSRERAQLAAQAPAMARALLKVVGDAEDGGETLHALGYKTVDEMRDVLRAAGVLP
jgi:hypothetical protein